MKDIKGKRFGVSTYGSLTDALTRYAVRQAGLDPEKDVQILQVGGSANALAAMQSGQIDASISIIRINLWPPIRLEPSVEREKRSDTNLAATCCLCQ